ncbi:MAG: D-alanine--D-serine ligase VanG [Roseburia sp.]|nr:D-alanine--D-serine ligase VanG [Roseburia sp.]MCM1279092.1 D-alanine--D-serine ligase VanG [Robinsoniella sp.]
MNIINIAVIFGGCSSEYPVSLQSAHAILSNLDRSKYQVYPIGITKEGRWFHYKGDYDGILKDIWHEQTENCIPAILSPDKAHHGILQMQSGKAVIIPVDAIFPVLHGKNGEDGTMQGLIELSGIPLIGCGTLSSALCMDKERAHRLAAAHGIAVPKAVVLEKGQWEKKQKLRQETEIGAENYIMNQVEALGFPLFVKPLRAGSSFGITKVSKKQQLSASIEQAFQYDSIVIVEENIDGFEVGCAILGNEELIVGRVDEIELSQGFFDYTEKYTLKSSKIHMPARIDEEAEEQIKKTAKTIYKALGCQGFARVDMFVTKAGEIVFNEVNTIPGFTSHSRFPNMMKGIGMSFGEILDKVIELGVTQ